MSKCCCKYAKWFPHNWLCLRGLSYVFIGFFYIAIGFAGVAIYQAIVVFTNPGLYHEEALAVVTVNLLGDLAGALTSLTIAKVLGALRAIKNAVAPCTCAAKEEPAKEETK